jgi:hypothetical protein
MIETASPHPDRGVRHFKKFDGEKIMNAPVQIAASDTEELLQRVERARDADLSAYETSIVDLEKAQTREQDRLRAEILTLQGKLESMVKKDQTALDRAEEEGKAALAAKDQAHAETLVTAGFDALSQDSRHPRTFLPLFRAATQLVGEDAAVFTLARLGGAFCTEDPQERINQYNLLIATGFVESSQSEKETTPQQRAVEKAVWLGLATAYWEAAEGKPEREQRNLRSRAATSLQNAWRVSDTGESKFLGIFSREATVLQQNMVAALNQTMGHEPKAPTLRSVARAWWTGRWPEPNQG